MAKDSGPRGRIADVLKRQKQQLLTDWLQELKLASGDGEGRITDSELTVQSSEFIDQLQAASQYGNYSDINGPEWASTREYLEQVSRSRVEQGFRADQTAAFIISLKKPLFALLRQDSGTNIDEYVKDSWTATELLDKLAMYTIRAFQKTREDVIRRQQEELLELSTPVVKLWDGVLALPMIGTLDSARTQIVMESLLQRIVDTGSEIAIIDITGVPTVDTLVAQHLLKTVTAIRLMGADCIISGIRPQIAQTIVHLGVDLEGVTTKANLADALALALKRSGFTVTRNKI